jgi:predicted Holliday junction resolvase-like endonuclease
MIDEDKANVRNDLKKQLLEAKLNNEIYKGQILEAQANKIAAQYVSAEDVRKVVNARNKVIRDTILKIPGRVSSAIAALKDASEIHFLLTNEIRNTLFELSNDTTV